MSGASTPEISVILVAGCKRKRSANALASVLAQAEVERAEIILIDVALDRFPPIAGSNHPRVRMIQMSCEMHIGAMRAYAARVARSPLVAYLEEHSLALPGWLKETLAAFARGDWAAVGGVVVPAHAEPGCGTLMHRVNFFRWTEDAPSGEIDLLPAHNTAYRRHLLLSGDLLSAGPLSGGDELEEMLLMEPAMQGRLRELGYKLYLEKRIRWIHLNEDQAGGIFYNCFCWNIVFGRRRVDGRSRAYRTLRIITTPLILPVRTLKTLLRVGRGAGAEWAAYLRLIPYILLIHLAETLGLGLGYLGGAKNIERALTIGELAIERESPPHAYDIRHTQHEAQTSGVAGK